jgi:RND family efflux transporter MFP subunit
MIRIPCSQLSSLYVAVRVAVVCVATLASAIACGKPGSPAQSAAPAGRGAMPPMPVEMVTLAPKLIDETGEFVGSIKSRRSVTVQPQAEGILTKIAVKSGDHVSPGTLIAEIDAAAQKAAAASLESMRTMREAEAAYARQQANRAKSLLDVGAMSQQEYEQAIALQRTAEAQLKAIEEQMRQQQAELAYYRVVAPTGGVVGDIPVRQGDRVTKATVLTTIDDTGGLEVYINVPVQQAPKLKVGLPVRILSDAGVAIASDRVSFVSPTVDDTTQTVLVKAPVESRAAQFRPDQFVRALIVFASVPGLTIPVVSVTRINGQYFAFVAEGGPRGMVAHQRPVVLGPVAGNDYLILSGLKAGDTIIVSGLQKIGDGSPVQAAPAQPGGGRE